MFIATSKQKCTWKSHPLGLFIFTSLIVVHERFILNEITIYFATSRGQRILWFLKSSFHFTDSDIVRHCLHCYVWRKWIFLIVLQLFPLWKALWGSVVYWMFITEPRKAFVLVNNFQYLTLLCLIVGGGGNFAIFWKFQPPFHFIITPPLYEFSKKFYPHILFLPPHFISTPLIICKMNTISLLLKGFYD